MYRTNLFEEKYGDIVNNLDKLKDVNGHTLSIGQQVYKLNGLIYKELDACRVEGIDPKESECYQKLLQEGKDRFEQHEYEFMGRMFIKKDII